MLRIYVTLAAKSQSAIKHPDNYTDLDAIIEYGARISHNSVGKVFTNPHFVEKILKSGHHSVAEHAVVSFVIHGCSRVCSKQLLRHRFISATEMSQRYVELIPKGVKRWADFTEEHADLLDELFFTPWELSQYNPSVSKRQATMYADAVAAMYQTYFLLRRPHDGLWESEILSINDSARRYDLPIETTKKEVARFALPQTTRTNLYVTANLREWAWVLKLRMAPEAQLEIRYIAHLIALYLVSLAPFTMKGFGIKPEFDSTLKEIFLTAQQEQERLGTAPVENWVAIPPELIRPKRVTFGL